MTDIIPPEKWVVWRKQLLARLAYERSYLLRQLIGLNQQTMEMPFNESGSIKDLLCHIAFWDAIHTDRLVKLVNGRFDEIAELNDDKNLAEVNRQIYEQHRYTSLETAVAMTLKERGGFIATLKNIPDDILHQQVKIDAGHHISPRLWTKWRFRHDHLHAQELEDWRQKQPAPTVRQIGPAYVLRAIYLAIHHEFKTLVSLIAPKERETRPVCGTWSLKELVAHILDWEKLGVNGLQQLAEGQIPEFDRAITDFDAFNAGNVANRQAQSFAQIWREFENTRQELLYLLANLPDEALQRPFTAPWQQEITGYSWLIVWTHHEHEHALDVRQALNGDNWPASE